MPRNYESDDQLRKGTKLSFVANIDCVECETTYEGTWTDDSQSAEDMVEMPVAEFTCPNCQHVQEETYPGWGFTSEAG